MYSLLEAVTKFATVHMAIRGQSFLGAGKAVVALLGRHGMDTSGVWWLPPLVLHSGAALLSACWGWGVYWGARCAAPQPQPPPRRCAVQVDSAVPSRDLAACRPPLRPRCRRCRRLYWGAGNAAHWSALLLAALCWLSAWLLISYFCSLLLNIVDALFVCYALDKEMRSVCKPEVHQLFCMLPAAHLSAAAAQPGAQPRLLYQPHPHHPHHPHPQQQQQQQQQQQAYAPPQIVPSYLPEHVVYGVPVQSPPVHGTPFMPPPPPPAAAAYAAPTAPPKR